MSEHCPSSTDAAIDAATHSNDSAQAVECAGCHEFYPVADMDEIDDWFILCPWCSETYHGVELGLRPCPECRSLKEIDEFIGDLCCDCMECNRMDSK